MRENLDYDVPPNIGLVDVDGDGALEAGYAALNSNEFICRDVWSGEVEWRLTLPYAPNSGSITADLDGDGLGEFLCGPFCIGAGSQGQGELRWQAWVNLSESVVADFDGDGFGELARALPGRIVVVKGSATP